jgi:hypothetical protein
MGRLTEVYKRVKKWNELRYGEQKHNKTFTLVMLREEYREWMEAAKHGYIVAEAKELADIAFVALGAISKFKHSNAQIDLLLEEAFNSANFLITPMFHPVFNIAALLDLVYVSPDEDCTEVLALVAALSVLSLGSHNVPPQVCLDILLAVCDSNDTKLIVPLASGDKGTLKGEGYVSAEPAIQRILGVSPQ